MMTRSDYPSGYPETPLLFIRDMQDRFVAILEIAMPNRAFASCIAFVAGLVMTGNISAPIAFFGILAILTTYSSQAVYNNIRDVEGDKINASGRPLANGTLSIGFAWKLMFALICCGFVFAYLSSPLVVVANAAWVFLGIAYSRFTKSMGMLSYVTLATTHLALPFASAYLIRGVFDYRLLMVIVFIYVTEVLSLSIKDYKDVEGDRKMGMRTLPIMLGSQNAARLTFLGFCMPLALVWLPWEILHLSSIFLVIYLSVGIFRCFLGIKLLTDPTPGQAGEILKKFRYVLMLQMLAWCLS